jgi:hypothetical protein
MQNQFNMSQAINICMASVKNRQLTKKDVYKLYYGHNPSKPAGYITGKTKKETENQFLRVGGAYQYAVLTRIKEPNVYVSFFNRALRKKFFSLQRKKK